MGQKNEDAKTESLNSIDRSAFLKLEYEKEKEHRTVAAQDQQALSADYTTVSPGK